jgi:hypothetical protein
LFLRIGSPENRTHFSLLRVTAKLSSYGGVIQSQVIARQNFAPPPDRALVDERPWHLRAISPGISAKAL